MERDEFHQTHWAVKEVDLFRILYLKNLGERPTPKVFTLSDNPVNPKLVSCMMPFHESFQPVYDVIKKDLKDSGYKCRRAKDIWVHPHIISDIIELICTSAFIVCDLSGKNSNVFCETGIADTLGKKVILIAQSSEDVPFDLRSIRHVIYENSPKGRCKLAKQIIKRINGLT